MNKTAVIICPGRGTYNATELGYFHTHHQDKLGMLSEFDRLREQRNQQLLSDLDSAERYSVSRYTRGDIESPLIYACSLADTLAIRSDIEIVAVTGNSMGWYTALAAAQAVTPVDGFTIVNTMGALMQEYSIGGQLIYPFVDESWQDNTMNRQALLELIANIDTKPDHTLKLSIDLGGMLVLAGNQTGLSTFSSSVPRLQERFPMTLTNHAAFHTLMQEPVALAGRERLSSSLLKSPSIPLIDGRGHIWWPESDLSDLWGYTLNTQVVETYHFTEAIRTAAQEFAPDLFIVAGPGNTLGGAVAQSLVLNDWHGMNSKTKFVESQQADPCLISMGMMQQRALVT